MLEELSLAPTPSRDSYIYEEESGSLSTLNLDSELYIRYTKAKRFLDSIENDTSIAPNQVAQVMNTITTILKEITRLQTELYNAERVKYLEQCMITAIKGAPQSAQDSFFKEYADLLKAKPN